MAIIKPNPPSYNSKTEIAIYNKYTNSWRVVPKIQNTPLPKPISREQRIRFHESDPEELAAIQEGDYQRALRESREIPAKKLEPIPATLGESYRPKTIKEVIPKRTTTKITSESNIGNAISITSPVSKIGKYVPPKKREIKKDYSVKFKDTSFTAPGAENRALDLTPSLKLSPGERNTFRNKIVFPDVSSVGYRKEPKKQGVISKIVLNPIVVPFIKKESKEKFISSVDKIRKKIIGKAQRGEFGEGIAQYLGQTSSVNVGGEVVRSRQGKAIKLAEDLIIGAFTGVATTKVLKIAGKIKGIRKGLNIGGKALLVTYVGGLPFRVYATKGKPDRLVTEFAGDVGFFAGATWGGLSWKDFNKNPEELPKSKANTYIRRTFKTSKKPPSDKDFLTVFKSLDSNAKKVKLVKAYKKAFGKNPNLEVKFNKKALAELKKSSKIYDIVATGKKTNYRRAYKGNKLPNKRQLEALRKARNKVTRKEIVRNLKKEQLAIKAERAKDNIDRAKAERRTASLLKDFKKIATGKQIKSLRKSTALINGKEMYLLPITNKYTPSRSKFLSQAKQLSKINKDYNELYENYAVSDRMVRLYQTFNNNKGFKVKYLRKLQEQRDKNFNIFLESLNNGKRRIINDLKSYIIRDYFNKQTGDLKYPPVKYGQLEKYGLKRYTESEFNNLIEKFNKLKGTPKSSIPKSNILFELATKKGRVVITKDGKTYVYKNVNHEKKTAGGQVQIVQEEVLVEVKQLPKQKKAQIQEAEVLQEATLQKAEVLQKDSVVSKTEQTSLTGQKQIPKLKLKLAPLQLAKQKAKTAQKLKLSQKQMQKLKLLVGQLPKQATEQVQVQIVQEAQKQDQDQASLLKLIQKQIIDQQIVSKQIISQKQRQKLTEKIKEIFEKYDNKKIEITEFNEESIKKFKIPDNVKKKLEKLLEKYKKRKQKQYLMYTPTLDGISQVAGRTAGSFTGFETRGNLIVVKPVAVHKYKRKGLKTVPYVRKHHRRKPRR